MSNTLILAYVGGSLGLVMVIYAYSYQMHQILNMYSMAIEIMRRHIRHNGNYPDCADYIAYYVFSSDKEKQVTE